MKIKPHKIVNFGFIKIRPTYSNTFITLTTATGDVILSSHAGLLKFKGSKKKTAFAAGRVLVELITSLKRKNIKVKCFLIEIQGFIRSNINSNVIKNLRKLKLRNIIYLVYKNIRVHNGLRGKKKRRV